MAKLLCGPAALCSVWIHTAAAVLREARSGPRVRQPEDEGGSGPSGSDGILGPGDGVVVPVEGEATGGSEWEQLKPKFTQEQDSALTFNTSGAHNLCLHDHFVPEMVVIGAMVSGTVSLAVALAYSPSLLWPHREDGASGDGWNYGQGHFFDMMYHLGRDSMGSRYPPCTRKKRRVAVDATSRYALDPLVPGNIASWYGVTMGPRLKFVYVLREPLERLHAHYWKANRGRWCTTMLPARGFASFVELLLAGQDAWFKPKPATPANGAVESFEHRCGEVLGASLYTSHLRLWFHHFGPSQFTIIPFQYITTDDSGRSTPAEALWEQLRVRGLAPPRVHANAAEEPYPKLDQELDDKLKREFWTRYSPFMGARGVAEELANTDAILHGFHGERTIDELSRWLLTNW